MTATTRPPLFDRIAFASLVPALALPMVGAVVASVGMRITSEGDSIYGLVIAVFLAVLLGSMTLNAWLLLRYPPSFSERALPRHIGILLTTLYVIILFWLVLILTLPIGISSVVLAAVIAALSIAICAAALARRGHHAVVPARASVGMPPVVRVLLVIYIVVAGAALLAALVLQFITGWLSDVAGFLGGPGVWFLIPLGLPWSWPLYIIGAILSFVIGITLGTPVSALLVVLMGLAVAANIVIAASLAFSPGRRTAITNWFFRLTPSVFVAVEVDET